MLGGLAYQSPDHASIKDLDLKNLSQINSEIAGTAVDVFVYDTSKDSDGGAWRHRTQHTSWYNETLNTETRGSRREFPAVAVIVLISNHVIIYDGDDPDLPMWMKIKRNSGAATYWYGFGSAFPTATSIYAMNGIIAATHTDPNNSSGGVALIRFIHDNFYRYGINNGNGGTSTINISQRESTTSFPDTPTGTLVDWKANDVAMTVLPNAPIDDATGLPIPTIAVATNAGVSVIKDDGTVVDITNGNSAFSYPVKIDFAGNNKDLLYWIYGFLAITDDTHAVLIDIPSSDFVTSSNHTNSINSTYNSTLSSPPFVLTYPNAGGTLGNVRTSSSKNNLFAGNVSGLANLFLNNNSEANSMVSQISSSYNTGWMHGDIKGAFLSDTDDTDVTGTELITNGTFNSDVSGWTTVTSTITYNSGAADIARNGSGGAAGQIYQDISGLTIGEKYLITIRVLAVSGAVSVYFDPDGSDPVVEPIFTSTTGTYTAIYTASQTSGRFSINATTSSSATATVDDISMRVAELDRSVNNKGLQVFGTITKTPVATGAELVGYSNWNITSGNYLEQPYNSDLNFGTGDYYISVWVRQTYNQSSHTQNYVFNRVDRSGGSTNGARFELRVPTDTGYFRFYQSDGSNTSYSDSSTNSFPSSVWTHVVCGRNGANLPIYINGKYDVSSLTGSANVQNSMTNTSAKLFIGGEHQDNNNFWGGDIALFRIGAGFPSAEQIKKIYEDEKVLFQENSAATLYGSSDAVTALAYDDTTSLLHVGTSSGRSEFKGLRRVGNTTMAVTTAISASNGLVAEQ